MAPFAPHGQGLGVFHKIPSSPTNYMPGTGGTPLQRLLGVRSGAHRPPSKAVENAEHLWGTWVNMVACLKASRINGPKD